MSPPPIFYLHVDARGCEAQLRLNDAPILGLSAAFPLIAFPTVSEWVIAGDNELSLELESVQPGARVHAALCWGQAGETPERGAENELIVIDWPPAPPPAADDGGAGAPTELPTLPGLPLSVRERGLADHSFGPWSWESSPPFDLDARTTTDLVDFVTELHAAVASGQFDRLLDASATKFNEVAPPYDMQPVDARTRLAEGLAYLRALPDFRLAAITLADLQLRLCCEGQLVEPTTAEGAPILRQANAIGGERWGLPIFIARTNWEFTAGQLSVVR